MTCGFFFRCNGCNAEARSAPMTMPRGWIERVTNVRSDDTGSDGRLLETKTRQSSAHFCGACSPAELGRLELEDLQQRTAAK